MTLQADLNEFVALLNAHHVDYVIVGAHAMAYHGYARYTGDLDILVRPDRQNADRVMAALEAFGFGSLGISAGDFLTPDNVVQLGYPPNRIDLLTSISGVSFEEVWQGRIHTRAGATPLQIIGKDALIRNKRAAGRYKDLEDLKFLEED